MGDAMPSLLRLYLTVRKPRNFLIILCTFIGTSLFLHFACGIDGDFGATNLILSIEASTAGAVLMMVAEESAAWQKEHAERQSRTLAEVRAVSESTEKMLEGVLLIAEAQREMLLDHASILRVLRDGDQRILEALMKAEEAK